MIWLLTEVKLQLETIWVFLRNLHRLSEFQEHGDAGRMSVVIFHFPQILSVEKMFNNCAFLSPFYIQTETSGNGS